ncbi:general stress protein [Sporosarcina sp. NPDC096371]|uniref:general stress protein n=1 Tax=Sporosarcina sp. NPDC096371 TaxID=3364530 RepID=UPI003818536C
MKKRLENRLIYLYSGELFSLILFIPLSYLLNLSYPNLRLYTLYSFWASFFFLEFLLLQGSIYWYTKLKRLRNENKSITSVGVIRRLKSLKKINFGLIIVSIIMFAIDIVRWHSALPLGGLLLAVFIYIFAILEFINYFYVQLSYDNSSDVRNLLKTKKLKRACINRDFKRIS